MDAVFKIRGDEFNEVLFKKIKALLDKSANTSVLIHVSDEKEAYVRTLQKSIEELNEPKQLLSFAMEDLEIYSAGNKNKKSK